jgi:hypothetical protein
MKRSFWFGALSFCTLVVACGSDESSGSSCFEGCESAADQVACVAACNGSGDGDVGGSDGGVPEPDTTDEEDAVEIEDTGTAEVDTPEPDVEVPEDSGVDAAEDAEDTNDVDDVEVGPDPDVVDDADAGAGAPCQVALPCVQACEPDSDFDACVRACAATNELSDAAVATLDAYRVCAASNCPSDRSAPYCYEYWCAEEYDACNCPPGCAEGCGEASACDGECGCGFGVTCSAELTCRPIVAQPCRTVFECLTGQVCSFGGDLDACEAPCLAMGDAIALELITALRDCMYEFSESGWAFLAESPFTQCTAPIQACYADRVAEL